MTADFRPGIPELLASDAEFSQAFDGSGMAAAPARRLAAVAGMDARVDAPRILPVAG